VADAQQAANLLTEAATIMQRQADRLGAQLAMLVAERYQQLPQGINLSEAQVILLLGYVARYLDLVKTVPLEPDAYLYVERWLDETFANLQQTTALYYRWAVVAQAFVTLADYPDFDEHLWDLENRFNLLVAEGQRTAADPDLAKFQALIAAYNGDPQTASQTWEQLGEIALAAEYAREAGDLERAYRLFHQAKIETPEALATTVKLLRLVQQLKHKHVDLRPAERQFLLAELAALQAEVAQVTTASPD
jgi:hypothetical protein